jgi:hypothetical protein
MLSASEETAESEMRSAPNKRWISEVIRTLTPCREKRCTIE